MDRRAFSFVFPHFNLIDSVLNVPIPVRSEISTDTSDVSHPSAVSVEGSVDTFLSNNDDVLITQNTENVNDGETPFNSNSESPGALEADRCVASHQQNQVGVNVSPPPVSESSEKVQMEESPEEIKNKENLVEGEPGESSEPDNSQGEDSTEKGQVDDNTDKGQSESSSDKGQGENNTEKGQGESSSEKSQVENSTENGQVAENKESVQVAENTENVQVAGNTENAQVAENTENAQVAGNTENGQVAGNTENGQVAENTEKGLDESSSEKGQGENAEKDKGAESSGENVQVKNDNNSAKTEVDSTTNELDDATDESTENSGNHEEIDVNRPEEENVGYPNLHIPDTEHLSDEEDNRLSEERRGLWRNLTKLVADIFTAMADPSFWERSNRQRGLPRTLTFIRSTPDENLVPHSIRIEITMPGFSSSFYTFISSGAITSQVMAPTLPEDHPRFLEAQESVNEALAVTNWSLTQAIRRANAELGTELSYAQASRRIENELVRIRQYFADRFFLGLNDADEEVQPLNPDGARDANGFPCGG